MKWQNGNFFSIRGLPPKGQQPATKEEVLFEEKEKDDKDDEAEKGQRRVGPFEWVWFISWGLLIPMLFYLFYGIVGLLVGLLLFSMYILLVYISVKPEQERQGLEEKAIRLQDFVDQRRENLARVNRQALDSMQRSVVRNIPGFRTRTPWKMIVATAFYLFTVMILIVATLQGSYGLALLLGLTALLFVSGTQDEIS
jgi:Ca2+/Na+ antiporter